MQIIISIAKFSINSILYLTFKSGAKFAYLRRLPIYSGNHSGRNRKSCGVRTLAYLESKLNRRFQDWLGIENGEEK